MKNMGFIILSPKCYFDLKRGLIVNGDKDTHLTAKEFKVLQFLVDREGEVVTSEELIKEIWKEGDHQETLLQSLTNTVSSLRHKEKALYDHIKTVRGLGYKFERTEIDRIKTQFLKEPHTFQERKDIFQKYLNGALLDRIEVLSNSIDDLHNTLKEMTVNEDEIVRNHYKNKLHSAILEYNTLNNELYSDEELVSLVKEPITERKEVEEEELVPQSQQQAQLQDAIKELSKGLHLLRQLEPIL